MKKIYILFFVVMYQFAVVTGSCNIEQWRAESQDACSNYIEHRTCWDQVTSYAGKVVDGVLMIPCVPMMIVYGSAVYAQQEKEKED